MTDTHVDVLAIPRPALIVLHNVEFDPPEVIESFVAALRRACGHDEFAVFLTHDDGTIRCVGNTADALALVQAALRQEESNGHQD